MSQRKTKGRPQKRADSPAARTGLMDSDMVNWLEKRRPQRKSDAATYLQLHQDARREAERLGDAGKYRYHDIPDTERDRVQIDLRKWFESRDSCNRKIKKRAAASAKLMEENREKALNYGLSLDPAVLNVLWQQKADYLRRAWSKKDREALLLNKLPRVGPPIVPEDKDFKNLMQVIALDKKQGKTLFKEEISARRSKHEAANSLLDLRQPADFHRDPFRPQDRNLPKEQTDAANSLLEILEKAKAYDCKPADTRVESISKFIPCRRVKRCTAVLGRCGLELRLELRLRTEHSGFTNGDAFKLMQRGPDFGECEVTEK
ncbi:hypothetical protein T439DRAFT_383233 [Meredithblackwellia eburnea MCA 4105]